MAKAKNDNAYAMPRTGSKPARKQKEKQPSSLYSPDPFSLVHDIDYVSMVSGIVESASVVLDGRR